MKENIVEKIINLISPNKLMKVMGGGEAAMMISHKITISSEPIIRLTSDQ